jgi:hypothetical protein
MFNTFLTIVLWRMAHVAFEEDANHIGWVLIFLSAFNFALVLTEIV